MPLAQLLMALLHHDFGKDIATQFGNFKWWRFHYTTQENCSKSNTPSYKFGLVSSLDMHHVWWIMLHESLFHS